MKIIVYAICKNEEKFTDRWYNSMKEADEIYVTDTGSADSTVKKLKEKGVTVNEIHLEKWRFDEARNISLSYVPDDADICVCTDLDEVFLPGWRKELEKIWIKGVTTRVKYKYIWNFDEDNNPGVTFYYEKIHSRHGFKWVHPVHETLEYTGSAPDIYAVSKNIVLEHHPDNGKSRAQYLELLELSVQEDPENDRNMHYLGREYMFKGEWDKCIETLKKHLSLPSAEWKDERSASMRYIARAYREKGNEEKAFEYYLRAIAEAPYLREGYVEAAWLLYAKKNYAFAYALIEQALKIKEIPLTYISEPFCRDYSVYDLGAICAYKTGLFEQAFELETTAFNMHKDDRIEKNIEVFRQSAEKKHK